MTRKLTLERPTASPHSLVVRFGNKLVFEANGWGVAALMLILVVFVLRTGITVPDFIQWVRNYH